MKKSFLFTRLSLLMASIGLVASTITFAVRYEYQQVDAWSGPQTSNVSATYYAAAEGLTGSALQSKLREINKPKSTSYEWNRYEAADEAENDSSSIISVYTRHNIGKSSHCGNYAWDKWNREHVWTQTKYPASKEDNHNIFACEGQINGYRSNKPYDELEHTSSTQVTVFGHVTDCYQTSSYFEPCDEAKGEIARAVMYGTLTYEEVDANYKMTNIIKSVELALKWHIEHPVTNRDIYRNNTVYGLQGNRNPFVDNPSYACKIWGNTNEATKKLCNTPAADAKLVRVSVSTVKSTIEVGEKTQYRAIGQYDDNSEMDVTSQATWSSSDTSVATVAGGAVTGVNTGKSTIQATFEGLSGTSEVNVVAATAKLTSVEIQGENKVYINREVQLKAIAKYSDGSSKDVTTEAEWKVADESIAMVAEGSVLGVAIGNTGVYATFEEKVGQWVINVVEKPVTPPDNPDTPVEPEQPDNPDTPVEPEQPANKGCKGSIVGTSIVLSTLSLVGVVLITFKKKEK